MFMLVQGQERAGLDVGVNRQAAMVHGGAVNLGSKNLGKVGGRLALQM